jgi:hypothetical protein
MFTPEITTVSRSHWSRAHCSYVWQCPDPGCDEQGADYESYDEAEVIRQAHADTHLGGTP